ncbi:hypothetical protein NBEOAGPD_2482 [Methylobacterium gregans]|uniref:Uncharacterized protein n=1 Tax=Methylobacterium gregans TaxID=374424 RepID=A0AA37HQU1_9HYPH|nr:hypothetical protein NBEOAGPD_2482 [Methylobacterium gregans]
MSVHGVMKVLDGSKLLLTDPFACKASGKRLEPTHDIEQFGQLAFADQANSSASVGQKLDQALRSENLESFPQRRTRNTEAFTEQPLRNPGTSRQFAFHDVVAHSRQ